MTREEAERREQFSAAIVSELYYTVHRSLQAGGDQEEALSAAFEELFRRIDFENINVTASETYEISLPRESLQCAMIAMRFGNFLAQRGILFNQVVSSNH